MHSVLVFNVVQWFVKYAQWQRRVTRVFATILFSFVDVVYMRSLFFLLRFLLYEKLCCGVCSSLENDLLHFCSVNVNNKLFEILPQIPVLILFDIWMLQSSSKNILLAFRNNLRKNGLSFFTYNIVINNTGRQCFAKVE